MRGALAKVLATPTTSNAELLMAEYAKLGGGHVVGLPHMVLPHMVLPRNEQDPA